MSGSQVLMMTFYRRVFTDYISIQTIFPLSWFTHLSPSLISSHHPFISPFTHLILNHLDRVFFPFSVFCYIHGGCDLIIIAPSFFLSHTLGDKVHAMIPLVISLFLNCQKSVWWSGKFQGRDPLDQGLTF